MSVSLVTGGAGFIGSHVAEHLVRKGHRVVVLDDLSGGFRENVPAGCRFVRDRFSITRWSIGCLRSSSSTMSIISPRTRPKGLSHFIKRFNYNNNVIGSVNLINASVNHDVKRFVFTSSIAVYGAGQSPMTEDDDAATGRLLRDCEVRGRAGAEGVARDVRSGLHHLPAAQRLR